MFLAFIAYCFIIKPIKLNLSLQCEVFHVFGPSRKGCSSWIPKTKNPIEICIFMKTFFTENASDVICTVVERVSLICFSPGTNRARLVRLESIFQLIQRHLPRLNFLLIIKPGSFICLLYQTKVQKNGFGYVIPSLFRAPGTFGCVKKEGKNPKIIAGHNSA